MSNKQYLIIGAGPAALAAVRSIRNTDHTGDITLVTREKQLPYSPAMLPYLLSHELTENNFFVKGSEMLEDLDAQIVLGEEVEKILSDTNEVQFKSGGRKSFDKLLIATGARPQIPVMENLADDQIYTLRTFIDFKHLTDDLGENQEIAIFGAGLVAVEAAEKLCTAGHRVKIIARSSLLRKYFGSRGVSMLQKTFEQCGTEIISQATIVSTEKKDKRLVLHLSNGRDLTADRLIIATGVTSNMVDNNDLAVAEGGFKVGKNLETTLPNIYAAGDIAAAPSFFDREHATCPILPEAVEQGTIAGANMAGEKMEYDGWVPCNYLRCFDEHMFSIGMANPQNEKAYDVLVKENGKSALKLVFNGEKLVGVEGLNMKFIHPGVFRYLIKERVSIGKYRQMLLDKPKETVCWLMSEHRKTQKV